MSFTLVSEENNQLEDIYKERALKIGNEDPDKVAEQILALRELVKKEENLFVPEDDGFYLMFLRGGQMQPSVALDIMIAYFSMRRDHFNYFQGFREVESLIETTFSQKIHGMLPHRDGEGRRIYVFRPGKWNPDKVPFTSVFCAGVMLCEMVAREERTQIAGITAIVDSQNFGWKQLRAIGMEDAKNIARFFNVSFPVWLRNSHVLHAPRVFLMFFSMLRPFMSEATTEGVVFHTGNVSDSLKNHFRLDLIPKDLGGTGPNFDNTHNITQIRELVKYFKDLDNFGYRDSQ